MVQKVAQKVFRKIVARTPRVRAEGKVLARQIAAKLPPKAKSAWYSKIKELTVKAAKVYAGVKKGLKWADTALGRLGVHNANQRIQNYIYEQVTNAAHGIGQVMGYAAPAFVGTVAPMILGQAARPMYDHPIGPPNINENIMGINFQGHY